MHTVAIALVVFICCFGAALAGMLLRARLPNDHLDGDSKDVVKLVMGLIATMAAIVLGLLIASAKGTFDTQASEMQELAAEVMQLDRMLVLYGPETKDARDILRNALMAVHETIWPADDSRQASLDPALSKDQSDAFYAKLEALSPKTELQRSAQSMALQLGGSLAKTRTLMFEQAAGSIEWPLLAILVFWLSVLFLGFGLFARFHITITVTLMVGAVSVASAVFLMLELSQPYQGLMRVPDTAFRSALAHLAQ